MEQAKLLLLRKQLLVRPEGWVQDAGTAVRALLLRSLHWKQHTAHDYSQEGIGDGDADDWRGERWANDNREGVQRRFDNSQAGRGEGKGARVEGNAGERERGKERAYR